MSFARLITLGIMLYTGGFVSGMIVLSFWWLKHSSKPENAWELIVGAFEHTKILGPWLSKDEVGIRCPKCGAEQPIDFSKSDDEQQPLRGGSA